MESNNFDDLPRQTNLSLGMEIYRLNGFWYRSSELTAIVEAQSRFEARDDDVFLVSSPKTGTTWLNAIITSIMNPGSRVVGDNDNDECLDPLIKNHPNVLIPSLEVQVFAKHSVYDISGMASPRLFRTHMAYSLLPESIKSSGCKIVYITREAKDTFVSLWHFFNTLRKSEQGPVPIAVTFDEFCKGVYLFGPFHDHVLEYWNESLKRPEKILFMKYEEMKQDPKGEVMKLASFLGRPFEKEEEAEKVVWRCSLERIKGLEVNKAGVNPWSGVPKSAFFRHGVVGDWKNSLTTEMKERLDEITRAKLEGSGLHLGI